MENEIIIFINVWIQVMVYLYYCHVIGQTVPKGLRRLWAILPIVFLFLILPFRIHNLHFGGFFVFFISWLANFKLLLFAFGKGPLSDSSLSLKHFVCLASIPIKVNSRTKTALPLHKFLLNYITKGLTLGAVLTSYKFSDQIPTIIINSFYCIHIYIILDLILTMVSALVQTLLGVQSDTHFNQPYLASSLQDFWGRRWNLSVNHILRLSVFKPTQEIAMRVFGPQNAALLAVFVTFVVSGLVHEFIFCYLGRARPTWEITLFFVLHGLCILIELSLKKKLPPRFLLPRVVSGPLTLGFIMLTAYWLFFPQLLRCNGDQKALQEIEAGAALIKKATLTLAFWLHALYSTLIHS
ncbi:hypothetical protein VNO77_05976 [Canavalia gladiata]|uniref:Wax synthase domain-containing protein n=2 Tax=Canavalia gladiata TaxID=3824 RepID=A0AAN9MZA0_CANGL